MPSRKVATFDEFYISLDPNSDVRGRQFEKFVKWFLKNSPEWQSKVEEIWLWDEYPDRWGRDCGIDLVFKERNGRTWAVQSKCISPDLEIPKKQIDSFLSESNDPRFYGRLLIASTDGIGRNAVQVIERQEKQVVCFLLNQFRQSEIEYPQSPDDLSTGRKKDPRTPRPHQIEAINAVEEGLKSAERGQLLMACGTGKTLTSLWIKERLKAKRTLVLLPSLSLLSQTLREWSAAASEPFEWICVCSDKSVAKQDKTEDDWITNLSEMGVPVTSDPAEIKSFLKGTGSKIVFSTYQSSPLVADAQKDSNLLDFDLTFADEAHRCAGKVSDAFGCVLDFKKIQSNKRLFLTATPRVLSNQLKKSASEKDIEVASMDNHAIFGEVLYQLKFSEAIEKDILSDYQVVIVGVDDEMIRNQIENRDLLKISTNGLKTDAETLASHIALTKATNDYDLQRMITFHGRVKGAKNFAEDHLKVNEWMRGSEEYRKEISTAYVSGEMNSAERNKRINRLKNLCENERGILTNARCLSEGVDVPTLDGIAFIDPRQSQVDIIQAVGRAIRKSTNKNFGTIVIPVYLFDMTENINDQVLASKFSNVWKIILALKSQDDSLMDEIDTLRVSLGQRGNHGKTQTGVKKVIFDLPEKIFAEFADKIINILIQNTSENWLERLGELKKYKLDNDNQTPAKRDSSLGQWCQSQRESYKNSAISKKRIELLNNIDFIWDPLDYEWQKKFYELKKFKLKHGHVYPILNNHSLGRWTATQRTTYQQGNLSKERVDLLNSINFQWDPEEEVWNDKFNELKAYKLKNRNANPTRSHSSLGNWCHVQRKVYKNKKMSKKRIDLLEGIGFKWNPKDDNWNDKFNELKIFFKENSHSNPISSHPSLGNWCNTQKVNYRKNTLSKERIELLESINFAWERN